MSETPAVEAKQHSGRMQLTGTLPEDGLTLNELVRFTTALRDTLNAVEREITGKRRARKQYRITKLVVTDSEFILGLQEEPWR